MINTGKARAKILITRKATIDSYGIECRFTGFDIFNEPKKPTQGVV
jgi:hypothetical protein